MLIRQRSTFADEFLLQVLFPCLHSTHSRRLLVLARFWNREICLRPSAEVPRSPALLRDAWRRVASVLWPWGVKASAH